MPPPNGDVCKDLSHDDTFPDHPVARSWRMAANPHYGLGSMMQVIVVMVLGLVGCLAWFTLRPRESAQSLDPSARAGDNVTPGTLDTPPKPPPPSLHIDVYVDGTLTNTSVVAREIVKIGRDTRSHVRLDAPQVNRMHAVIEAVSPEEITLVDLGSREGTMLNGQPIHKSRLRHGDTIVVGTARLIVGIDKPPPREEPPPAVG